MGYEEDVVAFKSEGESEYNVSAPVGRHGARMVAPEVASRLFGAMAKDCCYGGNGVFSYELSLDGEHTLHGKLSVRDYIPKEIPVVRVSFGSKVIKWLRWGVRRASLLSVT